MFVQALLTGAFAAAIVTFVGNVYVKRRELAAERAGARFDTLEEHYVPLRLQLGKIAGHCSTVANYLDKHRQEKETLAPAGGVRILLYRDILERAISDLSEALKNDLDERIELLRVKFDQPSLHLIAGLALARMEQLEIELVLTTGPGERTAAQEEVAKIKDDVERTVERLDQAWSVLLTNAEKARRDMLRSPSRAMRLCRSLPRRLSDFLTNRQAIRRAWGAAGEDRDAPPFAPEFASAPPHSEEPR